MLLYYALDQLTQIFCKIAIQQKKERYRIKYFAITKNYVFIQIFKTYGVKASPKDRRMSAERCGELCAISVANKCSESWMGVFPLIPFIYFHQYFPLLYNM